MFYTICPFQLVSEEIWYANPDGLQPQEVLSKVTREDFLRQNQKLLFTDESREHVFSHVCLFEPDNGIAVMKIANGYVAQNDHMFWHRYPWEDRQFATVVIVSRKEGMSFVVEVNEKAFSSPQQLVDIVCRGLNTSLNQEKLAVVPASNMISGRDEFSMMSACAVIGRQIENLQIADTAQQEVRKARFDDNAILASILFTSTLVDLRKATMVIDLLYELTKGRKTAKTILCPLRAAIDAGVMDKPSYKDFIKVFGCKDIVSKSKYSEFLNPKYDGYRDVGLYRSAKVKFLKLKTLDI